MPEELELPQEQVEETTAPAEEQGETPSESVTGENAETPKPPQSGGFQKRIDRLTREREEKAREAEYWRIEALKKADKPVEVSKEAPKDSGEPKEDDYATAAEYVKAIAKYAVDQDRKERDTQSAKQQQEQTQAQQQKRINEDLKQFRSATPDFDDVMEDAAFNSSALLTAELRDSDTPTALLYHFAKHPEDANRIAEMTDARKVAKEVAKIEAKLTPAPVASAQAPKTSTPPPIKPVAASRQAVANLNTIDDDTEYFRQKRAQQT